MSDKSGDLLRLLQGLGDAAHDDCEVAYDAIEEITRLRAEVEAMRLALLNAEGVFREIGFHSHADAARAAINQETPK
jgi:hypothetical protein